jgi:hypothetical protein
VGAKGRFAIEMTGHRFGRVTVLRRAGVCNGHMAWWIRCDCGVEKAVSGNALRRGNQKSCGCGIRTHNKSRSSTYKSWQMMWQRCTNVLNTNYGRYGARGVSVCDRWRSFEAFLEDLGERPDGTSLDRIDTRGNYESRNCRWANQKIQANNTRRSLGYSTLDGERISMKDMAAHLAMSEHALYTRLVLRRMRLAR